MIVRFLPVALPVAVLVSMPDTVRARQRPALIVIYNGLGTEAGARLWGRALEDRGLGQAKESESRWGKIRRSLDELESDEIRNAKLTVKVLGKSYPVQADNEGIFTLDLKAPLPVGEHEVDARIDRQAGFRVQAGRLLVWPRAPGIAVLSDIDDTILQTGVADKAKMIRKLLTSNAHDLRTFPHAPALYRAWAKRRYPVVFVSGSPVNLYPRLTQFLTLRGFPTAVLLLKQLGLEKGADSLFEQRNYKLRRIREVQALLPGYRLLLVGDSGEQDPEIYGEVRAAAERAVESTLIHRIGNADPGAPRFKKQVVFESYLKLARELAAKRLLSAAELKGIEGSP